MKSMKSMKSDLPTEQRKQRAWQEIEPSDGSLLKRSLAGDELAFEALVNRYRTPLLKYIRMILGGDEQAHDILQCVLLRLYTSRATLLADRPLHGWLYQVTHNRCIDELRERRKNSALLFCELPCDVENGYALIESIQDPRPLPEEIAEQHDLYDALFRAIRKLPPKVRPVVQLRCFGQLTFSEIGFILHMSETKAKTCYYRALPRLRSALADCPYVS